MAAAAPVLLPVVAACAGCASGAAVAGVLAALPAVWWPLGLAAAAIGVATAVGLRARRCGCGRVGSTVAVTARFAAVAATTFVISAYVAAPLLADLFGPATPSGPTLP